jgi:hypothetical protein
LFLIVIADQAWIDADAAAGTTATDSQASAAASYSSACDSAAVTLIDNVVQDEVQAIDQYA